MDDNIGPWTAVEDGSLLRSGLEDDFTSAAHPAGPGSRWSHSIATGQAPVAIPADVG